MRVKDAVGRFGEQVATEHLAAAGYEIVARNWRCRHGELDLVARDGEALVFVEVKTRSSAAFGVPAAAVDPRKIARLRRLAGAWLEAHRDERVARAAVVRFDVVAVLRPRDGSGVTVEHLTGAF
ncbi:YraN family protein [Jatrophihabitans fulvus]